MAKFFRGQANNGYYHKYWQIEESFWTSRIHISMALSLRGLTFTINLVLTQIWPKATYSNSWQLSNLASVIMFTFAFQKYFNAQLKQLIFGRVFILLLTLCLVTFAPAFLLPCWNFACFLRFSKDFCLQLFFKFGPSWDTEIIEGFLKFMKDYFEGNFSENGF